MLVGLSAPVFTPSATSLHRRPDTVEHMSTSSNEPTPGPDGAGDETEIVTTRLRSSDVARLDQAAARRGIGREALLSEAIDAFLAREIWSGGFIAPPPPMEIPAPFPWRGGAFRLRRGK